MSKVVDLNDARKKKGSPDTSGVIEKPKGHHHIYHAGTPGRNPHGTSALELDDGGTLTLLYSHEWDYLAIEGLLTIAPTLQIVKPGDKLPFEASDFEFDYCGIHWTFGTLGELRGLAARLPDGTTCVAAFDYGKAEASADADT